MLRSLVLIVAALSASSLHAQEAAVTVEATAAEQYAQAITDACLPVATGDAVFGSTNVTADDQTITDLGFEPGLSRDVFDRFAPQESGVLNRAIMGHRSAGDDDIVLAVGGALPGCKVILLSATDAEFGDDVASALGALKPAWRELPFENNRPGATVPMRRFIMRDNANRPFLINLITPPIPDSQLRLLAILSPIPANVQIPEGY